MNIHQISITYVVEQDRLLIRVNGKNKGGEFRAWLTRRLALALLPVLEQSNGDQMKKVVGATAATTSLPDQREQLLAAFEKEAQIRTADFNTPYQEQPAPPDAPESSAEPLLLTELKLTLMDDGRLRLQAFEKLPNQESTRHFQLNMEAQLCHGLLQLLHQSLHKSRWLEATPPALSATKLPTSGEDDTEGAMTQDRPRYLN
ncbi:hypothetical protein SAMN05216344_114112 [Polaromonas sp. OV174]|uniref:hypothetical protein n=1 Tax=Polaromonas sp. OV174 TaxID=1855300 RepID=UPI0008E06D4C|nr:hypothetical protein [Polaromonas sp. OV174]SFC34384.1 hypothetical protein SAMN05216344_114112 [Polaromonas sp. OV174]